MQINRDLMSQELYFYICLTGAIICHSPPCTQSAVHKVPAGHQGGDSTGGLILWSADAVPEAERKPQKISITD